MNKDKIQRKFSQLSFEDRDLTMFTVTNLTLTKKEIGNMVYMALKLKRKIATELLTTILLLLITIAVNLTIMLVMTTIFTSKIAELPPTSDMKMLDVWLIFCLFVPFSVALIQTAIEYYRDDTTGDTGTKKRGQPGSTMVRPGSALFETSQEV